MFSKSRPNKPQQGKTWADELRTILKPQPTPSSLTKTDSSFLGISSAPAPSIISVDMRVSGDLRTDGDVQVDGVVDGDVQSTTVCIGKTAEVNGEVIADKVRVWGRVIGRIRGKEVILQETAEITGDILHDSLEVHRGAFIDSIVKRNAKDEPKAAAVNLVISPAEPKAKATE